MLFQWHHGGCCCSRSLLQHHHHCCCPLRQQQLLVLAWCLLSCCVLIKQLHTFNAARHQHVVYAAAAAAEKNASSSTVPATLAIGGLLAFNSTNGRAAKAALELGVADVNADATLLPHTKLVLHLGNTNCNAFQGAAAGVFSVSTLFSDLISHGFYADDDYDDGDVHLVLLS